MTLNKLGGGVETKIPSPAAGPKMAKPPLWSAIDIERPIAARFEQIATFYPDRLAVAGGGQKLTYDQLNRAANRLAHAIQTALGNDMEPVAIRMEHGVQLIVTVLALLKAGKFFVPLDTMHPEERIRSILEHAG